MGRIHDTGDKGRDSAYESIDSFSKGENTHTHTLLVNRYKFIFAQKKEKKRKKKKKKKKKRGGDICKNCSLCQDEGCKKFLYLMVVRMHYCMMFFLNSAIHVLLSNLQ